MICTSNKRDLIVVSAVERREDVPVGDEGTSTLLSLSLFFFFAVVFVCADVFVFVFVFLQVKMCLLVMRDPPHPPLAASSGSSDATHPPRSRMVQKERKMNISTVRRLNWKKWDCYQPGEFVLLSLRTSMYFGLVFCSGFTGIFKDLMGFYGLH